jgi:Uma2 family endonuclease
MAVAEPIRRQWSRAEYYRMAELGWFDGQRTELVGGEVVVLNPQRFSHYAGIENVSAQLTRVFGKGYWVRTQAPLALSAASEPEPDISVVAGCRDDYTDHPKTAVLVVEVSDTTLTFDRQQKMSLYAQAGIREYWIVNLVDCRIEVYRDPVADPDQPFGHRYREVRHASENETIATLENPQVVIPVADLLP